MSDVSYSWLDSIFVDPVNTGANIFGAALSAESVDVAKKQVRLTQKSIDINLETQKKQEDFNLEIKSLLENILEQLIILNNSNKINN